MSNPFILFWMIDNETGCCHTHAQTIQLTLKFVIDVCLEYKHFAYFTRYGMTDICCREAIVAVSHVT